MTEQTRLECKSTPVCIAAADDLGCLTSGMLCTAMANAMIGPMLVKEEKATCTLTNSWSMSEIM